MAKRRPRPMLHRYCQGCEKRYLPTGKYQKKCEACKLKAWQNKTRKQKNIRTIKMIRKLNEDN